MRKKLGPLSPTSFNPIISSQTSDSEEPSSSENIPPGYEVVSLLEALNGPLTPSPAVPPLHVLGDGHLSGMLPAYGSDGHLPPVRTLSPLDRLPDGSSQGLKLKRSLSKSISQNSSVLHEEEDERSCSDSETRLSPRPAAQQPGEECGVTPDSENLTLSSSGAIDQSSCTGTPLSSTISSPEDPASSSLAQSVMSMVSSQSQHSQLSTDTVSSMSGSYIAPGTGTGTEDEGEALPSPLPASRAASEEGEAMPVASPDSNFVGLAEEQDAEGNDVMEEDDGSPTQEDGQRTCAFLGMECDNNNDFDIASVKALDNKLCSEVCLPGTWQADDNALSRRRRGHRRRAAGMIPPQEASARRREIEDKLKQEEETLSFIRDSLEKSDQLTRNMVSILSSFESRLMKLENSIIPVHKQTENLQRLQENVEKTLSCLDHVISYYHVASDTEKVIREGPTGRLDEYLGSMAKIQKAVEYFQDNSPDSPELNKVKLLFERGKESLESEFRSLMTRHSKVVSPVLILDLISGEEELEIQEEVPLEHLPEGVLLDVIRISRWLVEFGHNQDFMNVYYQIRSSQLDRSIKGLKEHFRKNSSASGVPYSPAIPNKRKDTPTKKPIKRPGTIRKAQNLLKQYSQHGLDGKKGGSNLIPLEGHQHDFRVKHLSEALNDKHGPLAGRDDMLDVETDAYIHCVSAFVKLAQSEYQLLVEVIPEHHQKKTFDSLIQDALEGLMLEGENIVSAARKAIVRHDFSAVLAIFPILRHLKQTKPEFDQVLQGTAASTKNKLPSLITSMETVGAKALEDFADNIKNDPDKEYNMPKDGTVHELTSNAILFLQQLLDFQETAGAMLASQVLGDTYNIPLDPRETSSSATSYSSEFSRRLLSTYICKVLGNLQLNLLSKSKVYEDPALSAIFLHNNYNYILKALEKSELIQLVAVTQKTAERSYREHIEQQIQTYQRSWLKVTDYITEKNLPVFQPGVKLRDKERQVIKERFKGFNDGLEELCKIQKAWAIPDTEQRDKIRQAQKHIVKETYGAFLHRYGSVPFTKNPEKYIKYHVEQVGDMIDRLFDTSA
ncbi:PREDICTED: exocyst complex component 7 isoform X3 [Myotis brandtii]|uniref:exocyst complex component 7 isoform X3 n=1 Tax=Myotis brandtii TaxID=109478 RepID=UPI000703D51D|nr:PREDICTED: exocyst complex component 7 isoform X3 [Myotis brandtii]